MKYSQNIKILLSSVIIALLGFSVFVFLQTPSTEAVSAETINFQGRVVRKGVGVEGLSPTSAETTCINNSGADTCGFRVEFVDGNVTAPVLAYQNFSSIELGDNDGVFNLEIGEVGFTIDTAVGATDLPELMREYNDLYMIVKFDSNGDATYNEQFTTKRVNAAPYALRAKYVDEAYTDGLYFKQGGNSFAALATLGTDDAYDLAFETGGVERMRIDTSGNVGIGTVTPSTTLELDGDLSFTYGGSTSSGLDRYILAGDGVASGEYGDNLFIEAGDAITSGYGGAVNITSGNGVLGGEINILSGNGTSGAGGNITIDGGNSDFGPYPEILLNPTYGGNVGIGTGSPAYNLDIAGSINFTDTISVGASSGTSGQVLVSNGSSAPSWQNIDSISTNNAFINNGNSFGGLAALGTNDTYGLAFETGGVERMRIDASGNVGIGTTSALALLEVVGQNDQIQFSVDPLPGQTSRIFQINTDSLYVNNSGGAVIGSRDSGGSTGGLQVYDGISIGRASTEPGSSSIFDVVDNRLIPTVNQDWRGLRGLVNFSTTGGAKVSALEFVARDLSTNTNNIVFIEGVRATGQMQGAVVADDLRGILANTVVSNSSGTAQRATGIQTSISNSGTINTAYGINITSPTGSGTINNSYGIYLNPLGGTNAYGIYQDSTESNYFGGNVGIGNASPSSLLDIQGSVNGAVDIKVRNTNTGANAYAGFTFIANNVSNYFEFYKFSDLYTANAYYTDYSLISDRGAGLIFRAHDGSGDIKFLTGGANERLLIDSSGNVGIGTSNPLVDLQIENTVADPVVSVYSADGGSTNLRLLENSGLSPYGAYFQYEGSSNTINIGAMENGVEYPAISYNRTSRNVGIGTTTPTTKLDVAGRAYLQASDANLMLRLNNTSTNGSQWALISGTAAGVADGNGDFLLRDETTGLNRFVINSNGSVGLGVTSPSYRLDVAGDINLTGALRSNGSPGTSGQLLVSQGSGSPVWQDVSTAFGTNVFLQGGNSFGSNAILGTNDAYDLIFEVGGSEFMRIDESSGRIGIGTTIASDTIDIRDSGNSFVAIESSDSTAGFTMQNDNAGNYISAIARYGTTALAYGPINPGDTYLYSNNTPLVIGTDTSNSAPIKFAVYKNSTSSFGEIARFTNDGYLGLGTTSPLERFEVYANGSDVYGVIHEDAGTHTAGLRFRRGGNDFYWKLDTYGLGVDTESNADVFTIVNSGNVGLGTTAPVETLEVQGNVLVGVNSVIAGQYKNVVSSQGDLTDYLSVITDSDTDIPGIILGNKATNNQRFQLYLDGPSNEVRFANTYSSGGYASYVFSTTGGGSNDDIVEISKTGANGRLAVYSQLNSSVTSSIISRTTTAGVGTNQSSATLSIAASFDGLDRDPFLIRQIAGGSGRAEIINTNANGDINFQTTDGTTNFSYALLVDGQTGNIGVGGTVSPAYDLDIVGDINFSGALYSSGASGAIGEVLVSQGSGSPVWQDISTAVNSSAFVQNGNTFGAKAVLGTNDAYGLAFEVGGTEAINIGTSTNVGFGVLSNGTDRIAVSGNLAFQNDTDQLKFSTFRIYQDLSTDRLGFTRTGTLGLDMELITDGVDYTNSRLLVGSNVNLNSGGDSWFNGGNVGVGTASPTGTLHIGAAASSTVTSTPVFAIGNGGQHGFSYSTNGAGDGTNLILQSGASGSISYTPDGGSTYPFYLNSDGSALFEGNLGIGADPLDTRGLYVTKTFNFTDGTGRYGGYAQHVYTDAGSQTGAQYGFASRVYNGGTGSLSDARGYFGGVYNSGGGTITNGRGVYGFVQNSSGNMTNAMVFQGYFSNTTANTVSNAYGTYLNSHTNTGGGTITNAYGLYVANQTAGTNNYSIYTNTGPVRFGDDAYVLGDLGVGTATPGSVLDVNGTASISGITTLTSLGAAGATDLCINGSDQVATCSSSIRYKNNVVDYSSGLDTVMSLRPVSFDWKTDDTADLGLIAEEVVEVDRRLGVYYKGELEGVKYSQLTAVLVDAVQEQQSNIETLTTRVDENVSRLDTQQRQIDAMQAQIDAMSTQSTTETTTSTSTTEPTTPAESFWNLDAEGLLTTAEILSINELRINTQLTVNAPASFSGNLNVDGSITSSDGNIIVDGDLEIKSVTLSQLKFDRSVEGETSVGRATVLQGEQQIIVETTKVTTNSLIFLTPKVLSDGTIPDVSYKELSDGSFTIVVDQVYTEDIEVDWWVIE